MAVQTIQVNGTDLWFYFGDDSGNFIQLRSDRIENVSSGNGDDRVIVSQNQLDLEDGSDNGLTKKNPLYRFGDIVDLQGGNDALIIEASVGDYYGGDGDDTISNDGPAGEGPNITIEIYGDDGRFDNTEGHGNDTISPGEMPEYIDGGGGIDWLLYDNADSRVIVSLGDVLSNGTYLTGTSSGGSGRDEIIRIENIGGSRFDDRITGNNVNNVIKGGDGDDDLRGDDGEDLIFGDAGDDQLRGGNDDDELHGGTGNDYLVGGQGNDLLIPGTGSNVIRGGTGFDTLDYSGSKVAIFANLAEGFVRKGAPPDPIEIDTIETRNNPDVENLTATGFDDFIFGNAKANILHGGGGNDAIAGLDGGDLITGGSGNDFLFGNQGVDAISGGIGSDWIAGGADDDFLVGNNGNDTIIGGAGSDIMIGESGRDTYIWGPNDFAPTSLDTVIGFGASSSGSTIIVDRLVFSGIVDDPGAAKAGDYLQANIDDGDMILTFDLDGTPGPSTGPNFSTFAKLNDFDPVTSGTLEDYLNGLQIAGIIEFI